MKITLTRRQVLWITVASFCFMKLADLVVHGIGNALAGCFR